MILVRDIMYCKPGKVRTMVDKFVTMAKMQEKAGLGKMRVMTDFCAEQYWTVVAEVEAPSLQALESMYQGQGMKPEDMKAMENLMKDYHELVDHGRREIYKLEG